MRSTGFPENIPENISNREELQQLFTSESEDSKFNCLEIRKKYLYAKCSFKGCGAEIRYKRKDETEEYRLSQDNRSHNHSHQLSSFNGIETFIKEIPLTIGMPLAKQLVMNQFKISESQFYYFFRKVRNQKISYQSLIANLNEMNCEIRSDPFSENMTDLPALMIIVTPKMKENFTRYGNWVGFDFTFNLVQENQNGKNWKVGCFMGISSSKKMVPYGLVLSTDETEERFYQIFKSFFDIMKKETKVIISDEDYALSAALKNLKKDNEFEGVHLLDCYHILKNVKKNLRVKQHWNLFKEMIYQETKEEYELKLNECLAAIEDDFDVKLLQRFVDNAHRYCFSQIPSVFFGFLPNTSMNEKLHDLLKRIIPYSKPFTVVVATTIKYLEELGEKCEHHRIECLKVETLFNFPWLKEVRYLVCKSIFAKIVYQFSKGISYESQLISGRTYQINTGKLEIMLHKDEEMWICSCEYLSKTGIPCSHLLRVLFLQKIRVSPYINNHWMIDVSKREKIRFQRKTRRNQIK